MLGIAKTVHVKNIFKMHVKIINTIFIRIWNKLSGTKTIEKLQLDLVAMLVQVVMQTRSQKFPLPICCKVEAAKDKMLNCKFMDRMTGNKQISQNFTGA